MWLSLARIIYIRVADTYIYARFWGMLNLNFFEKNIVVVLRGYAEYSFVWLLKIRWSIVNEGVCFGIKFGYYFSVLNNC